MILVKGGAGFYSTAKRLGIRASALGEPAPLGVQAASLRERAIPGPLNQVFEFE